MERETRMLLWTLFAVGVLTVGLLPAAWGTLNHALAIGAESNGQMAQVLWGQSEQPSTYVQQWAQDTGVPILPGAVEPHIQSITWDATTWGPGVTLTGYGFGNPPTSGKVTLTVADQTRDWVVGTGSAYGVHPVIESWSNDRIIVSGFSGYGGADISDWADGQGGFAFSPDDMLSIQVTNPETGSSDSVSSMYPKNAPMPVLTVDSVNSPVLAGTSVKLSGRVTFHGQGISGQAVSVSATSGSLSGVMYHNNDREFDVTTGQDGNFSIQYTAPLFPVNATITVVADGQTQTESIHVVVPQPTLTASSPDDSPLPGEVPVGQDVRLTASASLLPQGYSLEIQSTDGTVVASGSSIPVSTLRTEEHAGIMSYVAVIAAPSGQVVSTSPPVTISWVILAPTLQVSDPNVFIMPVEIPVGQNVLLTASADLVPTGYMLEIRKTDGTTLASSLSTPLSTLWTEQAAGSVSYVAIVVAPGGQTAATSARVTVNWVIPWSVSLTGTVINSNSNTFQLTATTNHLLDGTGYYLNIYDKTAGQWVASESAGNEVSYDFSLPMGGVSHEYVAYLVSRDENPSTAVATSNPVTATSGYDASFNEYVYGPYTTTTTVGVPWYTPSWAKVGAGQCESEGPPSSKYAYSVWVDPWTCDGTAYYYTTETVYGWHWQSYSYYNPPTIG